jgi:ribonuclease HI
VEASGNVGRGPHVSNNVAEYAAAEMIFEAVSDLAWNGAKALIMGDSKLVVEQLNGNWEVNGGLYSDYHAKAEKSLAALRSSGVTVDLEWIPREQNSQADALTEHEFRKYNIQRRVYKKKAKKK